MSNRKLAVKMLSNAGHTDCFIEECELSFVLKHLGKAAAKRYLQRLNDPEALAQCAKLISEISILDQLDFRGHFGTPVDQAFIKLDFKKHMAFVTKAGILSLTDRMWDQFSLVISNPGLPHSTHWTLIEYIARSHTCTHCGRDLQIETNGRALRVDSRCPYPGGYPAYVWEVEFPTGTLMVNDQHGEFLQALEDRLTLLPPDVVCDITTHLGSHNYSKQYAELGVAYGYVGNSCPGVFQNPNDPSEFVIANQGYDGETDDVIGTKDVLSNGFKKVGWICTDSWSYSIVDKSRVTLPPAKNKTFELSVPPGQYQITHQTHLVNDLPSEEEKIFAFFKKVS